MYKMEVPKNFSAVSDVEKFSGWFFRVDTPASLARRGVLRSTSQKPTNGGSGLLSIIALIKSYFGG